MIKDWAVAPFLNLSIFMASKTAKQRNDSGGLGEIENNWQTIILLL